jgi:hypothetical protein
LLQPFCYGILVEAGDQEFLELAETIARGMDCSFDDKSRLLALNDALSQVSSTAAALPSSSSSSSSFSSSSAGAAPSAEASAAHGAALAALASARAAQRSFFQSRLLEMILRVTLVTGASAVTEVSAGEVYDLEAGGLQCASERCGNADQGKFVMDYKAGDTICTCCGVVAVANGIFEGDWTRRLEDEKSTTQLGPASNPLLSAGANLGVSMLQAPGVPKAMLKRLQETRTKASRAGAAGASAGVAEKRTSLVYKDRMKERAWHALERAGDKLYVPRAVVQTAKEIFSKFRDNRELVHFVKDDGGGEAVAACLIAAREAAEHARRAPRAALAGGGWEGEEEEGGGGKGGGGAAAAEGRARAVPAVEPPPPPPPPPTEAELAAAAKRRRQRAEEEDKVARALGTRGAGRTMDFSGVKAEEEEEEEGDASAGAGAAFSAGEKACPRKACGGRLRHFKAEGATHDVMCGDCEAIVCFLCLAVWSVALPQCGCDNKCGGGSCPCAPCPHCAAATDCEVCGKKAK